MIVQLTPSTGVTEFLEPLIEEFDNNYSTVPLFLRGDSGFATEYVGEKDTFVEQ